MMESCARFMMIMKGDSGISKFGFLVTMSIEMEANSTLEIRACSSR